MLNTMIYPFKLILILKILIETGNQKRIQKLIPY